MAKRGREASTYVAVGDKSATGNTRSESGRHSDRGAEGPWGDSHTTHLGDPLVPGPVPVGHPFPAPTQPVTGRGRVDTSPVGLTCP